MLSNPLHRFSPYHNIPTTPMLSNTHVPTSHMHNAGMDALTQGSHYALQQLQQHVGVHSQHHNPHLARPGQHHMQHPHQHMQHHQAKHRQGPYGARGSSAAGPIRRRISRACDQCNQLRTKCDGQHPCAHCIEFGLGCEYIRERKKRGKASRKDLAQQAAAQAAATQGGSNNNGDGEDDQNDSKSSILVGNNRSSTADGSQNGGNVSDSEKMMNELVEDAMQRSQRTGSMDSLGDMASDMGSVHHHQNHQHQQHQHQHQQYLDHHLDASAGIDLNGYAAAAVVMHNPYERQPTHHIMGGAPHTPYGQSSYPDLPYGSLQAHSPTGYSSNGGGFRMAASPMTAYHTITGAGEPASPPWMSSPPSQQQQQLPAQQLQQEQAQTTQFHNPQNMSAAAAAAAAAAHMNSFNGMAMHNLHPAMHPALTGVGTSTLSATTAAATSSATGTSMPSSYNPAQLRYPVLEPIIPHLATIIPISLACDLIDLYFSSSSSAQMHPMSPYVLGFVFRKRSFLHPTKPRTCQPALLSSMLWVAAQTSDAPFIASVPAARGKICQKLLELTVNLLKPLIHTLPTASSPPQNGGDDQQPEQQQQPGSPVFDDVTGLGGLGMMSDSISMEAALAQVSAAAAVEDASISSITSADSANPIGVNASGSSGTGGNSGAFGAAGTIDDVVTYMHLATVVSASEYKGASLRWWNAAWCLARELKLGREVNVHGSGIRQSQELVGGDGLIDGLDLDSDKGVRMSEEEREERRRIWWLVYMVDRHLALCYNRPLFLLDLECDGLMRPMDDTAWQNGDFIGSNTESKQADTGLGDDSGNVNLDTSANVTAAAFDSILRSGPSYECSGHNIFGYFLPLMTILGEIVDLHHARNHPRFGLGCGFRSSQEWDAQISEITHHLAIYEQSLKAFEQRTLSPAALIASNEVSAAAAAAAAAATTDASNHVAMGTDGQSQSQSRAASAPHDVGTPSHSVHSVHSVHSMPAMPMPTMTAMPTMPSLPTMPTMPARMTELDIQTRIVTAYGTHVMHVLHILLAGKWDPVNLLDDNDLWISSQGFITATGHAVSAAEAISEILDYDPGLEFMPFFFGIYLLQGSFLLLLIADKLQLEASNSVVRACETIIRAHEACVVTLNTEYQRNFSRVMRSALAQARGRVPEDLGEQHMRRRELLSLYRWTGDGTGLAL